MTVKDFTGRFDISQLAVVSPDCLSKIGRQDKGAKALNVQTLEG